MQRHVRRFCLRSLVVSALAVGFLMTATPAVFAAGEVEFRLKPDGAPTAEVSLSVPPGESNESVVVFVSQTGDRPLDVLLLPQFSPGMLTILDATDQVARSMTLPAAGESTLVQLRVNAPRAGRYEGSLLLLENGRLRGQLSIVVTKATDTGLRLEGAGNGTVTLESPTAQFERSFRLLSSSRAATPVRLRVSPLTDPLSAQVAATVTIDGRRYRGEELTVPAQGELGFAVAAELPAGGDYRGSVVVAYGDEPLVVDLTVRRTRVAPTVAVESIATVESRMEWGFRPTDVDLRLMLRETNGQRVVLDAPALAALTRDARGGPVAAQFDSVQVLIGNRPTATLQLEPNQAREVTMRIVGLRQPGKYTGSLRLASSESSALSSPISILLHQGMVMAGLAIFLGVLISWALRWYLVSYRPALTAQLRLSRLQDGLKAALAPLAPVEQPEFPVVAAVQEQLAQLRLQYLRRERSGEEDLKAAAEKATRLPRWMRLRRDVDAAGNAPELVEQLSVIVAYLKADLTDPGRAGLMTKADAAFAELGNRMTPAATLSKALEDLDADAAARPSVRTHVEAARAAIGAGQMTEAGNRYDRARIVLAQELTEELDQTTGVVAPPGVDPADWDAARAAIAEALNFVKASTAPDQAETAYRNAAQKLLDTLVEGLRVAVGSLQVIAGTTASDEVESQLASVWSSLDKAATGLAAGDLPTARLHYEQARAGYPELRKLIRTAARMGPSAQAPPVTAPPVAAEHPVWRQFEEAAPGEEVTLPSAGKIRGQRLILDGATNAVILLVAVGLGLFVLFVPDAAWGGVEDWLTAILWGLGLHQIGDSAFGGFSGLRRQFATMGQPVANE